MRGVFLLTVICLVTGAMSASATLYRSLHFSTFSRDVFRSSLLPDELERISSSLPEGSNPIPLHDARLFQGLAKYFYRLSRLSPSTEERREMLCHSRLNIERALFQSPLEPGLLLAWVEITRELRQEKEAPSCSQGNALHASATDIDRMLQMIRALHPADAQIQFQVANLAEREKLPELASRSYSSFLSLSQSIPSKQAEIVEDWIIKSNAINALPPQLPQILFWSRRLLSRLQEEEQQLGRDSSRAIREALAAKQRDSIENRWGIVRSRQFPVDVFIGELLKLHPLAATDTFRREIDTTILQVAGTFHNRARVADSSQMSHDGARRRLGASPLISEPLHRLLFTRANSREISFVFGWSSSDVKPESGQLSGWGVDEPVVFDEKYRSVGLVTTPNSFVKLIVIQSEDSIAPELLSRIRLFTSDDNISWNELSPTAYAGELVHMGSSNALAITLKEESVAPMWKIHYASKSESNGLALQKNASIAVYGGEL